MYIYIFDSWNIDCDPGFHGVFCQTSIIRMLRRWNELKIEIYEKIQTKNPLGFRLCEVVSVWVWFRLVSLFNGISTFVGYFNAKAILLEEQWWCYLTHSWEDNGGSYLSQEYLSESERNSATGVRTKCVSVCGCVSIRVCVIVTYGCVFLWGFIHSYNTYTHTHAYA